MQRAISLAPALQAGATSAERTSAVLTAYHGRAMSVHSYSRCWIRLIWGTLSRERLLNKKAAAGLYTQYLVQYADEQESTWKINFVNPDHVHALIDLPTGFSIEKVVQLLKGSSSHWMNSNEVMTGKLPGQGLWSI